MGTVATLAVNVIANTGNLNKGLDSATKKAKGFGSGIGGAMKAAVSPAALAAAAIAAVGVALMKVNQAMERLDIVAKTAKGLGIKEQDLMGFQHAAELAGVSAGGFTTAMQKMQKGVGEAMAGTGLAKDALERMGIEVQAFGALNPDEQFLQLADKIAAIENPAERAAMATAIFGRAGADMLPMLLEGREGIEGQMEALKGLQGELSTADFQAIQDSNDAWTKLGKAFEGIWNQLAVILAPAFEMLADVLTVVVSWVAGVVEWFKKLEIGWFEIILVLNPLIAGILWLMGVFDKEEKAIKKVTEATKENKAVTLAAAAAEQAAIAETVKAREALEKKGASLTESLRNPMEMYTDTIDNLNMMLEAGVISWETYGRAVAKAQEEIKKSEEFKLKEIKVAERQAVGVTLRGRGSFSIQQKQHRELEKIRQEEKLQLVQLQQQTALLQQLNNNIQTGTVVTI